MTQADADLFELRKGLALALGRPVGKEFLVKQGSTALREGPARVKRDRPERDALIDAGVLVPDRHPDLLIFAHDQVLRSASVACGIVQDGNCSGRQAWRHQTLGVTLKEWSDRALEPETTPALPLQPPAVEPTPPVESEPEARPVAEALMASPTYLAQRRRIGRMPLSDDRIFSLLSQLWAAQGHRLDLRSLAASIGIPPHHARGAVSAVQRVLNVDQYSVLSLDETDQSVRLDAQLLREQFGVNT